MSKISRASRTAFLNLSQLEERDTPSTIQWVNRGTPALDTDGYNAAFGAQATTARAVTDAAILAWQNAIASFNYANVALNDTFRLTVSADPTDKGNGAAAGATAFDPAGKPTAGTVTMGVGEDGKGGGWFFDPNPADVNANFQGGLVAAGGGFVATASPQGPAVELGDYFSVVAIEITHALGFGTSQDFNASPLFTKTTIADVVNSPGTLYRYNGPSVRALFTSDNGNTTDTGSPIHIALPNAAHTSTDAQNVVYTGLVDTGNASYSGGRRYLPSETDALVLKDIFGFTPNANITRFGPGNAAQAGTGLAVAAPGPGGGTGLVVQVAKTGQTIEAISPYGTDFHGGFSAVLANDRGTTIVATAPGPGGGPQIEVFDAKTGVLLRSFFAYEPEFRDGVNVVLGDVNGDSVPDIITAPMAGGGPRVRAFDGRTGVVIRDFFAFDPSFRGGVNVTFSQINLDVNDGEDGSWIVVGAGPGGGPHVKVFGADTGNLLRSFFAYEPSFHGGVNVALGDVFGVSQVNIITAPGAGGGPLVRVYDAFGATTDLLEEFLAGSASSRDGLHIAAGIDITGNGTADILTAPASGSGNSVRVYDGATHDLLSEYQPFGPTATGGIFIGDLG